MRTTMHRPPDEQSASVAVVEAIAAKEGVETTELPVLYDAIDPDALDQLFAGNSRVRGSIQFTYCGYTVTVTAAGDVALDD
jgi:hypothetical protein